MIVRWFRSSGHLKTEDKYGTRNNIRANLYPSSENVYRTTVKMEMHQLAIVCVFSVLACETPKPRQAWEWPTMDEPSGVKGVHSGTGASAICRQVPGSCPGSSFAGLKGPQRASNISIFPVSEMRIRNFFFGLLHLCGDCDGSGTESCLFSPCENKQNLIIIMIIMMIIRKY